jgi:hypothetical protein
VNAAMDKDNPLSGWHACIFEFPYEVGKELAHHWSNNRRAVNIDQ